MGVWDAITSSRAFSFVRTYPRTVAIAVAVAAPTLGLTAALGGFAEAEAGPPGVLSGKQVETKVADVIVRSAEATTSAPGTDRPSEQQDYLQIRVRVEATGDRPVDSGTLQQMVKWPDMAMERDKLNMAALLDKADRGELKIETDDKADLVQLLPERSVASTINPGISGEFVYAWDLPKGTKLPQSIDLHVHDFEFAELTTLRQTNKWLIGEEIAKVTLPIQDSR